MADRRPIDLYVANGETHVALAGTLQEPLHLRGANLKLQLSGQDMSQFTPLTGVLIAKTPPYPLSGQLDFIGGEVHFRDFAEKVGSSDLEGTIDVEIGDESCRSALCTKTHVVADRSQPNGVAAQARGHRLGDLACAGVCTQGGFDELRAE